MNRLHLYLILNTLVIMILFSCENVQEGYTVDYNQSSAQFTVELMNSDRGTKGDSAMFNIHINSSYELKSILVATGVSGGDGSGYVIDSSGVDPLIDHTYGRLQPGQTSLDIDYNYIFPSDSVETTVTFTLIDEEGKLEREFTLVGVPSVASYDSVVFYNNESSYLADAFSTVDGSIYYNISNYTEFTTWNLDIQENFDIVFLATESGKAMLSGPYNGSVTASLSVKNKTIFKKLTELTSNDFDELTPVSLSEITEDYNVKKGSTIIDDVQVGDIIGFRTDFASTNPYKYGILRVNAIHPTNVDHYEGISYLIEMDVMTQQ